MSRCARAVRPRARSRPHARSGRHWAPPCWAPSCSSASRTTRRARVAQIDGVSADPATRRPGRPGVRRDRHPRARPGSRRPGGRRRRRRSPSRRSLRRTALVGAGFVASGCSRPSLLAARPAAGGARGRRARDAESSGQLGSACGAGSGAHRPCEGSTVLRTHPAGSLRAEHTGQTVTLTGWVDRRRDHGGVAFIDLRDASGIAQVVIRDEAVAHGLRNEYVLQVTGRSAAGRRATRTRTSPPARSRSPRPTSWCSTRPRRCRSRCPAPLDEQVGEEARLRYRYLDLRRPAPAAALRLRAPGERRGTARPGRARTSSRWRPRP